MDPAKSENYEFLDLSDVDDSERNQLKQSLFGSRPPDHLELPWTLEPPSQTQPPTAILQRTPMNTILQPWQPPQPYTISSSPQGVIVPTSPIYHPVVVHPMMLQGNDQQVTLNGTSGAISPPANVSVPPPQSPNNMYTQPPPSMFTMPPPHTTGYLNQHPQNVYVNNVTANLNLHGYVPSYIAPQTYPIQTAQAQEHDVMRGGGNRGRNRSRTASRHRAPSVESPPVNHQPYMSYLPVQSVQSYPYYASAAPSHHPNAQHATGSPIYIAPIYHSPHNMYSTYHPGSTLVYTPASIPVGGSAMQDYQFQGDVHGNQIQDVPVEHNGAVVTSVYQRPEVPVENVTPHQVPPIPQIVAAPIVVNNKIEPQVVDLKKMPKQPCPIDTPASVKQNIRAVPVDRSKPVENISLDKNVLNKRPKENDSVESNCVVNSTGQKIKDAPVPIKQATNAVSMAVKPPVQNNIDAVPVQNGTGKTNHKMGDANKILRGENTVRETSKDPEKIVTVSAKTTNPVVKISDNKPVNKPLKPVIANDVNTPVVNMNSNNNNRTVENAADAPKPVTNNINVNNVNSNKLNQNMNSDVNSNNNKTVPELQNKEPVVVVSAPTFNKSWASLFNSNHDASSTPDTCSSETKPVEAAPSSKPLAVISPLNNSNTETRVENQRVKNVSSKQTNKISHSPKLPYSKFLDDPNSYRLGEFLTKYTVDNRTVSLLPRGLTNRSNYCYVNSILQALLACPPFYNLIRALPQQYMKGGDEKSSSPIVRSMLDLIDEFSPLPPGARVGRREKNTTNAMTSKERESFEMINCGPALEPSCVYRSLHAVRSDTFSLEGRQEDAEEFLGCLLNGLNDEMLELIKLADDGNSNKTTEMNNPQMNGNSQDHGDEDEWKVMGPKNKGSVTRTADFGRSPISDIFRGQLRSRVQRSGDQSTDNVQPFFTLQLDIEKASSVKEALELLVGRDRLEGVVCSKTQQAVEAWQQVTLEQLPFVLILHLKCFHYEQDTCSKIIKNVEFPVDLKVDAKLLSSKIKYTAKQKQYKLFAVVYHDGKEASKGHYITDAYHVGYNCWVRYDDSSVRGVTEPQVLHPRAPRMPYLLYYRRCDTIGNQGAQTNKKE